MPELIEIEPGRWRIKKETSPPARSPLPCPHIISDIMDATEQVDGRFYTSKSQFRSVGKALGLIEVGTEKFKPKQRTTTDRSLKKKRREAIQKAVARYRNGERV